MLLIDALESRTDNVKLVEGVEKFEANFQDNGFWLNLDGAGYRITNEAFDTLLNLLRIPIKYIKRCVEEDGKFLAESSINYWLEKYGDLSFLIGSVNGEPCITQVFPGKRLYIPGVKVNDFIFDYLGDAKVHSYVVEDDVFNAVYITDQTIELGGEKWNYGVRVLYSDCFKITPRFDGVLCSKDGAILAYPTTKRKFRVAGSTIPQVFDQIEEFLDLSIDGLNEKLIPAFVCMSSVKIDMPGFVGMLCSDLRLSKKILNEIHSWFDGIDHTLYTIVTEICKRTAQLDTDVIDVELARDIQIAVCNFVIEGSFK